MPANSDEAGRSSPRIVVRRVRSRREKWVRRVLWWGVLPLVLYTLLGFFGVPLLIRHVAIPQLNKRIDGVATLTGAACNPFKLSLRLEDLAIADSAGTRIAGFKKFEGGFLLWDTLFDSGWHFDKAVVDQPELRPEIAADGRLNFEKLVTPLLASVAPAKPREPIKKIPRLVVRRLGVTGANIGFIDRTTRTPYQTEWRDLTFDLDDLDTRPERDNPHAMRTVSSSGETAEWEGSFDVNPLSSKGRLAIGGLELPRFMPYLEGQTPGAVVGGTLSFEVEYNLSLVSVPRLLKVKIVKGSVADLKVDMGGTEIVAAKSAAISNASIDADKRTIEVERVVISGALLALDRDGTGVISVTKLLPQFNIDLEEVKKRLEQGDQADPRTIPYPIQQLATALQQLAANAIGSWDVSVNKLAIDATTLAVSDAVGARPVAYEFRQIAAEIGPVRTSEHYKLPFELSLEAKEGGTVVASGLLEPFDRKATVKARTEAFNLAPAGGYLPEKLPEPMPPAVLTDALASIDGELAMDLSNKDAGTLRWTGAIDLAKTRLSPPGDTGALAEVDSLKLKGVADLAISQLTAKGLRWEGQVEVGGARVVAPVASLHDFAAAKLTADGRASVTLADKSRTLEWKGKAGAGGLQLSGALAGPVSLRFGEALSDGSLQLTVDGDSNPMLAFEGGAEISGLALTAPGQFKSSLALGRGLVEGAQVNTGKRTVSVTGVTADHLEVGVTLPIMPAPTDPKATKKSVSQAKTEELRGFVNPVLNALKQVGWNARIDALKISEGQIKVADESTGPSTELFVEGLTVEASNLSTDGQSLADVSISSKVQGSGQFAFAGKLDLFREDPVADVQISVSTVPAKPFDPFVGRYVGYLVERGRVNSTIPLKIQDGNVTGMLNFALDQFHLGEGTHSPDAPDIPIKLGLDLLRDGNDKVSGKIPLSGKLSDPGFSVVGLVWEAFFNLFFKAATAPFQILGSLFGAAEGQDLSMVAFKPGEAELTPDAMSTVDIIAKAMKERPAISMVANGRYNVEADTPGMRRVILREQMLKRVQDGSPYIEKIDDKQYRAAIEAEWKQKQREKSAEDAAARDIGPVRFDQMEKDLLEQVEVPADRFAGLAKARAEKVVAVLLKEGGVAPTRMSVGAEEEKKLIADKPKVELGVK